MPSNSKRKTTPPASPKTPNIDQVLKHVRIDTGKKRKNFRIADHACEWIPGGKVGEYLHALESEVIKDRAKEILKRNVEELAAAQELLWASNNHAVLVIFQAMDAAGKDGTIEHISKGLNPAGCEVTSFKAPSAEELDRPHLWRVMKAVPERGKIGIFNRSHYEDVLVVRVHQELIDMRKLECEGSSRPDAKFWSRRYEDINAFERHLARNGTVILKFFLNVSKEEQRKRLLARLDDPHKNWKFNVSDLDTRDRWDDYMEAYEDAIRATSTEWAPWHVIPADHKWVMRAMVAAIIADAIRSLELKFPAVGKEQRKELESAKKRLEEESRAETRRRGGGGKKNGK